MASADTSLHQRIRARIAQDLRPVKPLPSPARRVLLIAPFAIAVAVLAALRYGIRDDFDRLGGAITWGFSAFQWTLGLLVLALALRVAIPGRGVSGRVLAAAGVLAMAAVLLITIATYVAHPTFVPPALAWPMWYLCFLGPLEFGTPILIVATVLAARAFPTRPVAVGALSGLAAGLITDSGWRLTCWITVPAHVLGTHVLAVVALAAAGAGLGIVIDRVRDWFA